VPSNLALKNKDAGKEGSQAFIFSHCFSLRWLDGGLGAVTQSEDPKLKTKTRRNEEMKH